MAHLSPEEETRRWLVQARADLRDVEILVREQRYDSATFHAQQAAEKALKAYLLSRGEKRLLEHSIELLGRRAARHAPSLAATIEDAKELDIHYIPSRYPNGLEGNAPAEVYTRRVAEGALALAREVLEAVEKLLAPAP